MKQANRTGRFKSQKHRDYVRTFACTMCGSTAAIEVAHVRLGSDGAMGRKPSDYYCVSLCKPCHAGQHRMGERSFWQGRDVAQVIDEFNRTSPARREIEAHKREVNQ